MKCTIPALSAWIAFAAAQGVTEPIAPLGAPICSPDFPSKFELSMIDVEAPSKRLAKRQAEPLILTLTGGVLKDARGRTGYIASDRQFQFDSPPQSGAIYTAGFSVCGNKTLALATTRFFQCYTGEYYLLYDRPAASMCYAIYFDVLPYAPLQQIAAEKQQVPAQLKDETAHAMGENMGAKNGGRHGRLSTATLTATLTVEAHDAMQTANAEDPGKPETLKVDTATPTPTTKSKTVAAPQINKAPTHGNADGDGASASSGASNGGSVPMSVGDQARLGMFVAVSAVHFGIMFL